MLPPFRWSPYRDATRHFSCARAFRNHSDSASLSLAFIDSGHANSPQSGGGEVRPLTSTTTAKSGP